MSHGVIGTGAKVMHGHKGGVACEIPIAAPPHLHYLAAILHLGFRVHARQ